MKKFIINLILIITIFIIYFLSANFFNWFTIAGVMPNLFVIYVLFIGLFGSKNLGAIYGVVIGVLLDIFIGSKIGVNAIALATVGIIASIFDKNFSKDSRITLMFMVVGTTILAEIIIYFLNYFFLSTNLEIIKFVKILFIEVVYNILITIIIYPIMQRFGYYMENEFKENKILTRYF